ncbi:MAG: tetratricopeptide repeat protein [Acidobacteria bacterium]|nr:tetratricopeptide repeat protein [Acidobacteriota bacterium]
MAADNFTDIQLDMLTRRWRADTSPRLTLELADLYRRRGQLEAALPVIEKGLEARPHHVSLQVALGRYRLETGDARAAASILRDVVDKDPGHLVASKLLIRAYLGLEDLERAGARLELYAVLNDSDPDLAKLRAAVAGHLPPDAAGAPAPLPQSFLTGASAQATELPSLNPPAERSLVGALDREPFVALHEEPLEPTPISTLFGLEAAPDEVEEQLERSALTKEPGPRAGVPADELALEAEPEPERAAVGLAGAQLPSEPPELEERQPASAAEEIDAGAAATVTLGALYLAQGHLDDARSIFERVLRRDPEDAEALAGLKEIERRLGTDRRDSESAPSGSNSGKIDLLRSYLGRLLAAADRLSA